VGERKRGLLAERLVTDAQVFPLVGQRLYWFVEQPVSFKERLASCFARGSAAGDKVPLGLKKALTFLSGLQFIIPLSTVPKPFQ
jgi:hypothetical protein